MSEIPDLRVDAPAWIDFRADRERAHVVDDMIRSDGLEAAILDVFRNSRQLSEADCRQRARRVLAGADRIAVQLDGWLHDVQQDPILEIGVGPGQLGVALARRGHSIVGIDVSLEWLVVAKHWCRMHGREPDLAAAVAEHLPLESGSIASLVSLDVIEHVGDQADYVREIARVLRPGGRYALVTPNRYSLAPEPHVGVWGVGYLPRRFQAAWVKLRSGRSYRFVRLLSVRETRRLFARTGSLRPDITFPKIDQAEIDLFAPQRARLARVYNRLAETGVFRLLAPTCGAYFRITGGKPASA